MIKLRSVGFFGLALATLSFAPGALACGGEGKEDKDEPAPSALCGGEGKEDKDEPQPSVLGV